MINDIEKKLFLVFDEVSKKMKENTIFFLDGEVGAGKTTFVKNLLSYLYNFEEVNSPSFNIINQYYIDNMVINHIDLYRLDNNKENRILISGSIENFINFIEWPENVKIDTRGFQVYTIKIEVLENGERRFEWK